MANTVDSPRWFVALAILIAAFTATRARAESPYEGRNFRMLLTAQDMLTVTFTDPLPVTSADSYFDVVIDGSTWGEAIVPDQRVYTIAWHTYPQSTAPVIFGLGTYGTVAVNGVLQPSFDAELIASVEDVDMWLYGPDPARQLTLRGSPLSYDPLLSEKWSTLEYLPSAITGLSAAESDLLCARLAAATLVDYGFAFNEQRVLALPCTSGSFVLTPRSSLGPDNFKLGRPQHVSCTSAPRARVLRADNGTEVAAFSTFVFPDTTTASPAIEQAFDLCNDGGTTLRTFSHYVSGNGFTHVTPATLFVDPGRCERFAVRFRASAAGTYGGFVSFGGNGTGTTNFSLRATATGAGPALHVHAQTVTRQGTLSIRAVDQVLVTDQNNQPVPGVQVAATFSGPSSGNTSGASASNGRASLSSSAVSRPRGSWCFTITGLSKAGYSYNPAANVITTKCE